MFNALSESTFQNQETLQRRIAQVERENAQLQSSIKVIERQNMVLKAKAEKVKYDKKDLYREKAKLKKAKAKFAIELEKEEEREKELLQSQQQEDSVNEPTSTTETSETCDITTDEETTTSPGDGDNEKAPITFTSETKATSESKRDTKNPWGTSKAANKPSKLNKDAPVFKPGVQQHSHDLSSAEDATEATSSFDESMSSNDAEQQAYVMLSPTGELMITPLPHSFLYAYTAAAEYFQMDDDVPPPPNNDGYYDGQFVDEAA